MTDAQAPDPFAPATLGPVRLRNRFVKAATFEGLTREHVVNDELIAFHRKAAAGGVGMTTLAYCAVAPDGCGTPNELILTPEMTADGNFAEFGAKLEEARAKVDQANAILEQASPGSNDAGGDSTTTTAPETTTTVGGDTTPA